MAEGKGKDGWGGMMIMDNLIRIESGGGSSLLFVVAGGGLWDGKASMVIFFFGV